MSLCLVLCRKENLNNMFLARSYLKKHHATKSLFVFSDDAVCASDFERRGWVPREFSRSLRELSELSARMTQPR